MSFYLSKLCQNSFVKIRTKNLLDSASHWHLEALTRMKSLFTVCRLPCYIALCANKTKIGFCKKRCASCL